MLVLGISGGFRSGYQDVSACLVRDGRVLAAIEEERINRIKFSPGILPAESVKAVMKICGVQMNEIDAISFHGITWEKNTPERVQNFYISLFGVCPPVYLFHHHDCHAAATYFESEFKDALILTMDNSGDGISTQIMHGNKGELELIKRFERPNSLGLFYQVFTQFCGFKKDSDEYKLMGLSSYGNGEKYDFSWLLSFKDGDLKINTKYIKTPKPGEPSLSKNEIVYNDLFLEKIKGKKRLLHQPIDDFYKDVAASAQRHLERIVSQMVEYYCNKLNTNKVCLAGGVALNCAMNQKLMNAPFVKDLFVYPASNDASISVGSAWLLCKEKKIKPIPSGHTYLGKSYSEKEILESLHTLKIKDYYISDNVFKEVAQFIHNENIVGWFQGRMEFGPRALGSRSILANPMIKSMNQEVNKTVKFRETFRPFCPSVLKEDVSSYFEGEKTVSQYMTINYRVKPEKRSVIPAVTHVDGTARIQTVDKETNPAYYELLKEFKLLSGHGVLLNTSFNIANEPIVESPRHAIASFYGSGLDVLVLENIILKKK